MTDRSVISVEGLSKAFRIPHAAHQSLRGRLLHPFAKTTYEEFQALEDVSFDVREGEFFGIVGRNGSGKSTLLKILAGIYRPDSGVVRVDGSLAPFIELGVGFNPELSARDNVFINGALLGLTRARIVERYEAIVEFAELHRFMDMKLRNFSSGMQVRLAFAIALEAGADILLTDEVLAVGDENFQRKCFDVFRQRKAEGRTVVFVTHDMSAVLKFCDRAMLLHRGQRLGIGDTTTIVRAYHELNEHGDDQPGALAALTAAGVAEEDLPARITRVDVLADDAPLDPDAPVAAQGADLVIRVRVEFRTTMVDPIIGIQIVDRHATSIVLTNNWYVRHDLGECPAGSTIEVDFGFSNRLSATGYQVHAELAEAGPGTVFQVRRGVAAFDVEADVVTLGAFDPELRISHREAGA